MVTESDVVKFKVTQLQWERGLKIGMSRYSTKNKYGSTRNLSRINTHVCGAVAEVVFADWQGFQVDETINQFVGDNRDFVSRQGETIDVKQSSFAGQDIELKEKVENVEAGKHKDIYVLCRAVVAGQRVDEVHIIGWITHENYIRPENKREPYVKGDPRYPWNYVVGKDKLEPFVDKQFGKELSIIEIDEMATWG